MTAALMVAGPSTPTRDRQLEPVMTTTFNHWPRPSEGTVEFAADCPCGAAAVWEQRSPVGGYRITCRRCARH
jgi:hypothetical protein